MSRYTSATDADREAMLEAIGSGSIDDLFADIPERVRLSDPSEADSLMDVNTYKDSLES